MNKRNGHPTDVVLTIIGEPGNWRPAAARYNGEIHRPGFELVDGRVAIEGHPYHLVELAGRNQAESGEWAIEARYRADGYNILITRGQHTEPCLENPIPLDEAILRAQRLVTQNLMSLGSRLVCTVVPQVGKKREFGHPVAVCDGTRARRDDAYYLWRAGEYLPVQMMEEAAEEVVS